MKMKEFEPREVAAVPGTPLGSANESVTGEENRISHCRN